MNKILATVIILVLCSCAKLPLTKENESKEPTLKSSRDGRFGSRCSRGFCSVSVAQLVITPERYHGKLVQVKGVLSVQPEAVGVTAGEHSVWVNLTPEQYNEYRNFNGMYGYVQGTYDGTKFGHMGMWGGTLDSVTRFGE
jgi:hypothetical protein